MTEKFGLIKSNWELAEKFFNDNNSNQKMAADNQSLLVEGVSVADILRLLEGYQFHPKQAASNTDVSGMIEYLKKNKAQHKTWNVVLRSLPGGKEEQKCIIAGKKIYMTERSREEIYKDVIKTGDLLVDFHSLLDLNQRAYNQTVKKCQEMQAERAGEAEKARKIAEEIAKTRKNQLPNTSLLVLYPIYKNSKVPPTAKYRKDLNQKNNLMGLAVLLSGEKNESNWGWLQARARNLK